MKKISLLKCVVLTSIILLLSGCSVVYINSKSIDETVSSILSKDTKLKSVSLDGYSYYLPQGVNLKVCKNSNSILYYNHDKMYMYVDLVSYYHKVENTYKENNNSYYSKKLSFNNKSGYLEITEIGNKYFIEFMYNYSKIEAYSSKKNLNKTLTVMAYILNSVRYQDLLLDSLVGEGSLKYTEESFNIFKSNGNDSNFLDIIEKYDDGRTNSRDEDRLELDENIK